MDTVVGSAIMLLIGFVIWSAATHRGVKHVLGWSALGFAASIAVTTVVMMLMPPLPEIQEQLRMPPEQGQAPLSLLVSFVQYNVPGVIWSAFSVVGAIRQLQKGAHRVAAETSAAGESAG